MQNLTSGVVHWEPDFAIGLAQKLDLAITLSPKLYAKDIDIALKIITTLFDYESKQNSSTLVSARTKEFAKVTKLSHVPPFPGHVTLCFLGILDIIIITFKCYSWSRELWKNRMSNCLAQNFFLLLPLSNLTTIVRQRQGFLGLYRRSMHYFVRHS